jgi:Raf kinase inhibitor-like YbhB/YbcL family protein
MKLSSKAFNDSEMIPVKYTCQGPNVSPPLTLSDIPEKTKSLALILVDPDAPSGKFVHWVVYNIPPEITELEENLEKKGRLANGILQGINDFGQLGYGGPCPEKGTHRYYFKLYALDTVLDLEPGTRETDLLKILFHHNIAVANLKGRFAMVTENAD